MNNLFNHAKKLALLTAGLSLANLALAQTQTWNTGSGNWSASASWSPNAVPGAATNVVFTNNVGAPTSAGTVDNTVDAGFTSPIASLTYANTNTSGGSGFYHTTQIPASQTLTVLGNLNVGNSVDVPNSQISATMTGSGTLLVSNLTAGVNVSQGDSGNGAQATLNMTNLNTFNAYIGGITVGVYNTPNPSISRQKGYLYLARTNNINILGNAPRAYGNESQIELGEALGNGSNIQIPMYLGLVNNIYVNSITVCADKQGSGAIMTFNPVFTNSTPTAYFRGTNGVTSRVASWTLGDNSNQTTTGSGCGPGVCDFTAGYLDAMVNVMTVGKGESGASSGTGNGSGTFTFSAGTNNVNVLYLGYRIATGGSSVGTGTLNVNGTGTLVANNAVCLSYWNGGTANGFYSSGTLNINGGSVYAATITNGVTVSGATVTANVNMTGGLLQITTLLGNIGTPAYPIGIFQMNNSLLELPVAGNQTNVACSVLEENGSTNFIGITSVPASVISYPAQFPLISYGSIGAGSFNFALTNLPGTYQGYISNNTAANRIDLVLTNGPTSLLALKWNGNLSGNWDVSTLNWLNGVTPSLYSDGATVLFDDTATGATNVILTSGFSPTTLTFNNSTLPYAFGGSGDIIGVGNVVVNGTGSVLFTNTGVNSFVGGMSINSGTVQFGAGGTAGNIPVSGNVTNNGNLIFDLSSTALVADTIYGTGTLAQNGSGVLNLTGANTFSGSAAANAGTLLVNGTLSGTLANAAGSTIGGNGTNVGTVTVSGSIQPGTASATPTTFTTGNLNLQSGAGLTFNLNGPSTTEGSGSNDLVNVVGSVVANNNTVTVKFAGIPQTSTPYTVVSYSGGLSGTFNSVVAGTHYTATVDTTQPNVVNVDVSGTGANLKWDASANGTWDLGVTTNWENLGTSLLDVFYAGDSVTFDDTAPMTNVTINSGVVVAPTAITVNSTRTYTIGGSGQVAGAANITKLGTGTLSLSTPNVNLSGLVSVQAGTLVIGNNAALGQDNGTPGLVTAQITNSATMDLKGDSVNSANIIVSGAGVGGNGAIINSGADQIHAVRYLTLGGNTSLGGSNGRWDVRLSGSNQGALNGDGVDPFTITKVGTNYLGLVSVGIDGSLGNVDIQGGIFSLELLTLSDSGGWAGDTTHTITIENGATLNLNTLGTSPSLSRNIVMNGASTIASGGGNALGGSVTLNGSDTINVNSANLINSGVISGSGSLTLTGGGVLALQNANTYTGNTVLAVNGGSISLNDSASIASTNIIINSGSYIDVSPRTDDTLTLASGQLLQGNGGVNGNLTASAGATVSPGMNLTSTGLLNVSNSISLGGTAWMKISATNTTSDLLTTTNGGIAYGGTLVVTNLSGTITNGQTFHLFNAPNYTSAFGSLVLPSGTGLTWTNNLAVNGSITAGVVTGPAPQPHITSVSLSGTNLVISGTNGVNGEQFNVLTTTNLTLPLSSWTVLPTNTFSGNNFNLTNAMSAGTPQSFYILRVP